MVQSLTNNFLYRATDKIESNTLLNRGIVDAFGYAVPTALNANNKYEARERLASEIVFFAIAFLSPLVSMPAFNKFFLKKAGIIEKFSDKGVEIVRLSKKHLVKDSDEMLKGMKELIYDLRDNKNTSQKVRQKFKNIDEDFQKILNRFDDKEILRTKLLKAHTKIAIADYVATGLMLIGSYFGVKDLTTKLTGRTGFSAEYGMADDAYTKKNAEKHEQNKLSKILTSVGILALGSAGINKFVEKSFLKSNPTGLMKKIKDNATNFNYTDGKFMKLLPYFLITVVGDLPPSLLSTRDKYEFRDSAVRTACYMTIFFGGDLILNGMFGRIFDKVFKTKLVNKENLDEKSGLLKKMTAPIYSLEELRKKSGWDKDLLKRTQKFGVGMYWLNLALVTIILGTIVPKALNHLLRKSVHKDLNDDKSVKKDNN